MRKYFLFCSLLFIFVGCDLDDYGLYNDDDWEKIVKREDYFFSSSKIIEVKNFEGFLFNPEKPDEKEGFHKFSFSKGKEVPENSEEWDIAIGATNILVNGGESGSGEPKRTGKGGAYVTSGTLESVKSVDFTKFVKGNVPKKWYTYNAEGNHIIRAIKGKVIIIRTHNGKYAKMAIKSYYKDGKEETYGPSRYYTFDYIYE